MQAHVRQLLGIGVARLLRTIDSQGHHRWRLRHLQNVRPLLGVVLLQALDPPKRVLVHGLGLAADGLKDLFSLSEKAPQDRIEHGTLTRCVHIRFGRLHRLIDQGVGLIGQVLVIAHQRQAHAQQVIDLGGRFFSDQVRTDGLGQAPLPQAQKKERLNTRLETHVQAQQHRRGGAPKHHLVDQFGREVQELPQGLGERRAAIVLGVWGRRSGCEIGGVQNGGAFSDGRTLVATQLSRAECKDKREVGLGWALSRAPLTRSRW